MCVKYWQSDVELSGRWKVVEGSVVEEMVVEGPRVIRTLAERVANEKTVVEGSVTKNTINKKMEVDLLSA